MEQMGTFHQANLFSIFLDYKKIGTCSFSIVNNAIVDQSANQLLPASWRYHNDLERIRPYLRIDGLETFAQRNQGNGRLCLQALLGLSKKYGCGGRMLTDAHFESALFYERCGFKGQRVGQDDIKYFDPTEQNLELLFKNSLQNTHFKFIPLSVPATEKEKNSNLDKELFNRMLQKASQNNSEK